MTTFWILIAVLSANGIDPTLYPYQETFKTKQECLLARQAIVARAKANNIAVVSACIERTAV